MSVSNYTPNFDFIKDTLDLDGAIVQGYEETHDGILVHVKLKRKPHICPECGCEITHVHDHRKRTVQAGMINGKKISVRVDRRRLRCTCCGKRFYEEAPFLMKYQRVTISVRNQIFESFAGSIQSVTDLSHTLGLSASSVRHYLDLITPAPKPLPRVMGIDEFKGNAGGQKFQVVITDLETREVVDILEDRSTKTLVEYFNLRPEKGNVEVIAMDLSNQFRLVAATCFPEAEIVADRFHLHRSVLWSMGRVRKSEQKHLGSTYRKFFKHSKRILYKRYEVLSDAEKEALTVMFQYSSDLLRAWMVKEAFFDIMDLRDGELIRSALGKWIKVIEDFQVSSFYGNVKTIRSWIDPVVASALSPYSNGFTEGVNNKIKVLKRNAYGLRNADRFRSRIMLAVNVKRGTKLCA